MTEPAESVTPLRGDLGDRAAAFRADRRRGRVVRLAVGAAAALTLAGVTAWLVTAPDERTADERTAGDPCPGVTAGKPVPAGYPRQLGNHDCGTVPSRT